MLQRFVDLKIGDIFTVKKRTYEKVTSGFAQNISNGDYKQFLFESLVESDSNNNNYQ